MEDGIDLTLYEYLKDFFGKDSPVRLVSGKNETAIRCPFCGDSQHSKYKTHMYIINSAPFAYYCHRCEVTGGNATSLVKQLKIYDPNLTQYVNKASREALVKSGYSNIASTKVQGRLEYNYIPSNTSKDMVVKRKSYLEDRMGTTYSFEELANLRYILDLEEFVNVNNISTNKLDSKQIRMLNSLNDMYSLFMLADNSTIIGRNMGDVTDSNPRYIKLNLSGYVRSDKSFYSIRNSVDLSKPVHKIYLTEGIYDLLGVYNLNGSKQDSNELYIANNGKGYLSTMNYILSLGIMNADIVIYSDTDVDDRFYRNRLKNSLLAKNNGINIIYNVSAGEKDFGVPLDRIKVSPQTKVKI